jgi:hypothetical protein
VVNFILQTMDPTNSVMRKTCFQSSMTALKEVVRVFPMVALNDTWTRLAVGDVIGETNNASIRVYDMQRYLEIKYNLLNLRFITDVPEMHTWNKECRIIKYISESACSLKAPLTTY